MELVVHFVDLKITSRYGGHYTLAPLFITLSFFSSTQNPIIGLSFSPGSEYAAGASCPLPLS